MSWAKRRTPGQHSTSQSPPVQMYNPNQHSTQENQWQHNWYSNPQQQQQQQQPPQHYQQEQINPSQTNYWSQPYENPPPQQQNANNPNSNQTYGGQQYTGGQTPAYYQNTTAGYEQQAYGNLQFSQQQQFHQNQNNLYAPAQKTEAEGDAWNWTWGDEDNSNVQPVTQNAEAAASQQGNNIGDSFANDESWNWSLEESRLASQLSNIPESSKPNSNNLDPKFSQPTKPLVNTEKKSEISKAIRGKLETPQWSTESQISQESSDDILHTSESDKSHLVSRSSTISHSPVSGQDFLPPPVLKSSEEVLRNQNSNELPASRHPQFENKEIVNGLTQAVSENNRLLNRVNVNPAPPSPKHTPPPPKNTQTPPLLTPPGSASDDSRNPYKRSVGLPYKPATFKAPTTTSQDPRQSPSNPPVFHSQQVNLETVPDNSEHPDTVAAPDTSVKRVQQWPENNEAPINDRNQYLETGQLSDPNQAVAVEYSQGDSRQESNDTLPPPGLQRMIPGQFEQNENGDGSISFGDEQPPPGLSRMVLGQTEAAPDVPQIQSQEDTRYDSGGPPDGLRRMVPGESSSPETSLIQQHAEGHDSDSEFLQHSQQASQSRSATIGADTPPSVQNVPSSQLPGFTISQPVLSGSRSETIGGDIPESTGPATQDSVSHVRVPSISTTDNRVINKTATSTKSKEKNPGEQNSRRDYIEGQNHQSEIASITNSIRTLTVGENLTDGQTSNNSLPELSPRRRSRQESSDSESDRQKLPRNVREKKSLEKLKSREKERDKYKERDRERGRERYSPDPYKDRRDRRDRKYRDTRYDDESDYYSDKEKDKRVKDDRERDYDKKYSSLRREKEKRRKGERDPRERDYPRDRRGDYYYNRYEDDYKAENRSSRPSSRSDSMHESYRERRYDRENRDRKPPRDRDRVRERDRYRQREAYNPYQNVAYDPYNPYYQQYQYYENLRRTNPQAYAEWYRKYYQQQVGSTISYGEDRASVHSGRSSANDELAKDRYTRQSFYSQSSLSHVAGYYGQSHNLSSQYGLDNSSFTRPYDQTDNSLLYEEQQKASQRFTPSKFSTAHIKASISSGKLLRILPNYPMDGQTASVEICNLPSFLEENEEYRELSVFPGPLVKGTTHKKTIIEYCDSKIRGAIYNKEIVDVESYILMWELLILLIRQNGMVVGTDIAELLLKNKGSAIETAGRPSSVLSSISSTAADLNHVSEASNQIVSENTGSLHSILKEEDITNKFREYLLYGSGKEALEWAMKHGLWGHALFLASKLDKRTYANVMMRFANGLPINDPLQTLYQLLSGKIPAAVTCVSDDKWGDWKPHLAMVLSNSSHRPELNCKAITSLGDTLMSRGSLYAAQFCYLMAEVGFGKHDNPETKMVLLGSDHRTLFPQFATNEAIHMTEIYEYACSLNNQDFVIPEFQIYKYLLATRLADMGMLEKSLQYLEKVSYYITSNPTSVSANFVDYVCYLADKLKFYDPVGDVVEDETEFGSLVETSRPDTSWLKDLRAVQSEFQAGNIAQETVNNLALYQQAGFDPDRTILPPGYDSVQYDPNQEIWRQQQLQNQQQNIWHTEQQPVLDYQQPQQENIQQQQLSNDFSASHYTEQHQLWPNQQQQQQQVWEDQHNFNLESVDQHQQQQNYFESSVAQPEPEKEVQKPPQEETPTQPQISMPNQGRSESQTQEEKKESPVKRNVQSPKQEKVQSTGWFGGIFSKLAMKPKNQMKLPDDKNPKIVWDQEKKRWTNVDEDPTDPANEFKPPPKMSDLMPKANQTITPPGNAVNQAQVAQNQQPLKGSHSENNDSLPSKINNQMNMFKMQRNRNVKNAYVDVFNPGGKASTGPTSLPAPDQMPSTAGASQMNFFIPQTIHDPNAPTDFLTPAPPMPVGEPQKKKS